MEYSPWFIMILGMGTVFVGLFVLILLTKILSFFAKKKGKTEVSHESTPTPQIAMRPALAVAGINDRMLFDAVISAALAEYIGANVRGIRIKSLRQLNAQQADRGVFTAVVSAAIATAMGEDVEGLKITSIRRI